MARTRNIAVIVGSLRSGSFSRGVARALAELAPDNLKLEIIEIGQLPFYNQDLDQAPLPEWTAFRERIRAADGVLFVTPEYNRSVPGVLKNAIDVASRPYGHSAWDGKPAGVVSVTPGGLGAFGANHHLRQSLVFLNMPTLAQPEAYLSNIAGQFEVGELTGEKTRTFLKSYIEAYASWVEKIAPAEVKALAA
ncbi:MAG: NAD(P)H-dependent oxidoreductase [Pseudomonadota bacterium]|nr:NAD(P)H-dependent oxidoreductase [Pseudomonadota bacterium]